jgi:predicted PurR-regulated permease PerM
MDSQETSKLIVTLLSAGLISLISALITLLIHKKSSSIKIQQLSNELSAHKSNSQSNYEKLEKKLMELATEYDRKHQELTRELTMRAEKLIKVETQLDFINQQLDKLTEAFNQFTNQVGENLKENTLLIIRVEQSLSSLTRIVDKLDNT